MRKQSKNLSLKLFFKATHTLHTVIHTHTHNSFFFFFLVFYAFVFRLIKLQSLYRWTPHFKLAHPIANSAFWHHDQEMALDSSKMVQVREHRDSLQCFTETHFISKYTMETHFMETNQPIQRFFFLIYFLVFTNITVFCFIFLFFVYIYKVKLFWRLKEQKTQTHRHTHNRKREKKECQHMRSFFYKVLFLVLG